VTRKFGSLVALNDVSFDIKREEIIGLVGPNGAGKTTTLKIIANLLKPHSGRILLKNSEGIFQEAHHVSQEFVEQGFLIDIPDFYNTNPWILLKHLAIIRHYPNHNIEHRIDQLLKFFDLYKWKYVKIKKFSKGMKQKLAFITAILNEPDLIVLDEPQTGLDPESRIKIREYMKSFKERGKTVIISSHLLDEIREICDKIIIINKGKVIGFDTIDNLEMRFKTKQIRIDLFHPLKKEQEQEVLTRIEQGLQDLSSITNIGTKGETMLSYDPTGKSMTIYYDGSREIKRDIFKLLSEKFAEELEILEFYEPRRSQIENLYSQTTGSMQVKSRELK
jgi:ABC-2 type transport system ATP-binding protein